MAGLAGLSPELVEQIYAEAVNIQRAELAAAGQKNKTIAPTFRLATRGIEGSTRNEFTSVYFEKWRIEASDEKNIKEIYDIIKTPGLTRHLHSLVFYIDSDHMIRVQQERTSL
jgi:hypothetical protein